jgi:hypothetical protein
MTLMTTRAADSAQLAAICCGKRLRTVSVASSRLLFTYCGQCEVIRWFADGRPVERETAVDIAGAASRADARIRRQKRQGRPQGPSGVH